MRERASTSIDRKEKKGAKYRMASTQEKKMELCDVFIV